MNPATAELVDRAVEMLLRHPEADERELPALLAACGMTPAEGWRAYQFLSIAFTHVVMRDRVKFSPGYVLYDPDSGVRSDHLLLDQPLYVAGVVAAERLLANGCTHQQLMPIVGRSAEYNGIRQGGVWLNSPLLLPFRS